MQDAFPRKAAHRERRDGFRDQPACRDAGLASYATTWSKGGSAPDRALRGARHQCDEVDQQARVLRSVARNRSGAARRPMTKPCLRIRFRRDRKLWGVDWDAGGHRRRPLFSTEEAAHEHATEILRSQGVLPPPAEDREITLRAYATRWLAIVEHEKDPDTVREYRERPEGYAAPSVMLSDAVDDGIIVSEPSPPARAAEDEQSGQAHERGASAERPSDDVGATRGVPRCGHERQAVLRPLRSPRQGGAAPE
ncbi:MAG: hypothetical protein ACRELW_18385 [Candidatus Rokuibacteriota bacterium]